MLLRVRGNGASPENSQAALVYLRGFRLSNTRPPVGVYTSSSTERPLLYSHFHVGIQAPAATSDAELSRQLRRVAWKEIWNMYDIVYDEVRLFPDPNITTALLSSSAPSTGNSEQETAAAAAGFTRLTARSGAQKAVVVTHYLEDGDTLRGGDDVNAEIVVLDVSAVPLGEAATRIAVEVGWIAAYATMQGAFERVTSVVVRLPYACDIVGAERSPVVQEGLNFIGEHIVLLAKSFTQNQQGAAAPVVDVCFIGSSEGQLQGTLTRLCSRHQASDTADQNQQKVAVFIGDHHQQQQQNEQQELLQSIASSLEVNVCLEVVPLKCLLEGDEEPWDPATTRENQVLNFCPCCGHCGGH